MNGQLSTSNSVKISQLGTGTGTPLPMLSLSHDPGIGEYFPLYVTQTRVGVGTNNPLADFHLANSGVFLMTRTNGNEVVKANPIGSLRVTTDGFLAATRGIFINDGNSDFFSATPISLQYRGDFIIKDASDVVQFKVFKDGLVRCRELKVDLNTIPPDYVFNKEYKLLEFKELAEFIKLYGHLPNIPSAKEMEDNGSINVGEMQFKLLEKIEELTLYILLLKKENDALSQRLWKLENN